MEHKVMDDTIRAALYARVSSQRQAEALTIQSQVDALRERIVTDGLRVRDMAWSGSLDRLYIHSPDRLARNYAYQVVLLEEFARYGVEVVFLNHTTSVTPEGNLLLQMQGMIAEYERAKIMERSRRGRRYAARQGRNRHRFDTDALCPNTSVESPHSKAPWSHRPACTAPAARA